MARRARFLLGLAVVLGGVSLLGVTGVGTAANEAAPTNTKEPRILGDASVGSTLTAVRGLWAGSPTSYRFQWVRCPQSGGRPDGSDCAAIGGANDQQYVLVRADQGLRLRVRVTASNADGSTAVASDATPRVLASTGTQQRPANTSQPRILGDPNVGSTLTAVRGMWSGSPASYRFQWVRCPNGGGLPDGSNCAAIGGATGQQYVLGNLDAGRRLRVRVTAANANGQQTAASNATPKIGGPETPIVTQQPTIAGNPTVGSTLAADPGQWRNSSSIAYQWRRCNTNGAGCANIGGADGQTYHLVQADRGSTIRVRVAAKSGRLTRVASSAPTAVIRPAASSPTATGCPAGTGPIQAGQLSAPARMLVQGQQLVPGVVTQSTGSVTARFRVTACGGRPVQGAELFATAVPYSQFTPRRQRTDANGWATLQMGRLGGFPANPGRQELLVMMVRATKGGTVLGGVSTRRLVSFPVNLAT